MDRISRLLDDDAESLDGFFCRGDGPVSASLPDEVVARIGKISGQLELQRQSPLARDSYRT